MTRETPAALKGEKLPVVTCPGCNKPMTPGKPEPISSSNLADIVYRCENCGTTTTRTVKGIAGPDRRKRQR
jgi:RNase P subunit RPR2